MLAKNATIHYNKKEMKYEEDNDHGSKSVFYPADHP